MHQVHRVRQVHWLAGKLEVVQVVREVLVVQEVAKVQVIPIPEVEAQVRASPNSGVNPDWQQVLQQEQLQVQEQVHQQEQVVQVEGD